MHVEKQFLSYEFFTQQDALNATEDRAAWNVDKGGSKDHLAALFALVAHVNHVVDNDGRQFRW